MLDFFGVFTRGGALLWTLQCATALRHNPIDALNALIRTCLLEERSNDNTFTYVPKTGAHQALKWTFHNGMGLVFVAVYQKSLSLLYVDELLALVKSEFCSIYQPSKSDYSLFRPTFDKLLKECEARADLAKRGAPLSKRPQAGSAGKSGAGAAAAAGSRPGAAAATRAGEAAGRNPGGTSSDGADGDAEDSGEDGSAAKAAGKAGDDTSDGVNGDSDEGSSRAFDVSKLKGAGPRGGPRGGRPGPGPPVKTKEKKDEEKKDTKKKARKWDVAGFKTSSAEPANLDFSDMPANGHQGNTTDASTGYGTHGGDATASDMSDADIARLPVSNMDVEPEEESADEELDPKQPAKATGVLGSFLSRLSLRVMGSGALSQEDLAPALADMKKRLMERNVAEEIAANVCASVGKSLEGQKLASFTGVGAVVRRAFEEALAGILHKRQVDVLLDIRKAQERGKPYVIVFCGVNGVGKSTNLAKIAYWLGQHNIKVTIAACDTFRAGAVEQLKTHCARLRVPLYERGYEKDPAKVAYEAVKQAERDGRHVVLVDTAGRMQDNEPLMRALSNLISVNDPQLVLFVGEALVGNDAVDQLTKFSRALQDLSPQGGNGTRGRRGIDGIVLTKFDTIDDKVGAALSMVYSSGAPVMFVGCGQTYVDLKKLNVKSVVNSLLK